MASAIGVRVLPALAGAGFLRYWGRQEPPERVRTGQVVAGRAGHAMVTRFAVPVRSGLFDAMGFAPRESAGSYPMTVFGGWFRRARTTVSAVDDVPRSVARGDRGCRREAVRTGPRLDTVCV